MSPKKQAKLATKLYARLVKARPSVEQAAEIVSSLALAVIMSAPPEQRAYVAVQFLGRIAAHAGLQVVAVRSGQARELPRG